MKKEKESRIYKAQTTFSPVLEVGDILAPGTRVHVDTAGIVIVSEEFILNASFNSSH